MLRLVLCCCAGAGAVQFLPELPAAPVLLLIALIAAAAWPHSRGLAAVCLGFAWTAHGAGQLLARDWPCARDREDLPLTVRVVAPAVARDGHVELELRVLEPRGPGAPQGRLRLSWYDAPVLPRPGQDWRVTARLRCRSGFANGGGSDRELDLLRQRIVATGYLRTDPPPELLVERPWRHPVERLRSRVATDIDRVLAGGPSAGVLQGLAVGLRGAIPGELWEAFAATGTAHLIAISGLHVTAFALVVLILLRAAWRLPGCGALRWRVGLESALVLVATAGYTLLAGASLPALRTLAMVAIVTGLRALRRTSIAPRTLALAALVLVAGDPLAVSSAGFWLSFVATWALLALADAGQGWPARLVTFARAQWTLLIVLAPVLAVAFGRLSLVAPLANAVAIPVFSFLLLPATLAGTAFALVAPGSPAAPWGSLGKLLDQVWPWLIWAGQLPGATWATARQPLPVVALAGLAIALALVLPQRGLRIAAAAMLLAVICGRGPQPGPGTWTLAVLDVGQGLAAVVRTGQHTLVFDTGPRWRGGGTAARTVLVPWLRAAGVRRIDRLVVSHGDADHAGGVATLQQALPVAQLSVGPDLAGAGTVARCSAGQQWDWDGVHFRFLHPPGDFVGSDNEGSCVLAVTGSAGSALLLADAERAAEMSLSRQQIAADVVLLPHHGSRSSSTPVLVQAVGAGLGIASAGFGNQWGLPHAEVVARWRATGTTVLTTASSGAVSVHFGARPGEIRATSARSSSRRWWQRRDGARYHAVACGKSSSSVDRSCGRS
ncbi:MAG: DNA internalization-related competence protein ComEC/Rec2 [Gammaproteobacteria bacterium]|nr:MAG: DNA internalization-related competence protein ComEC/Rec2 [Gammaproteobacteria bacterium]